MEKQTLSAESIARQADEGQDVSSHYTNDGRMMPPFDSGEIDPGKEANEDSREAAREKRGTGS